MAVGCEQSRVPNYDLRIWNRLILVFIVAFIFCGTPESTATGQTDESENRAGRIAGIAVNAQNRGEFKLALQQWESLIKEYPQSSYFGEAHYHAGVCHQQLGQNGSAIERFRSALKLLEKKEKVKRSNALFLLGYCQQSFGRSFLDDAQSPEDTEQGKVYLTSATRTFDELKQNHPDFPDLDQAYFFQGNAYESLGRLSEAATSFEKSLKEKGKRFRFDSLFALANINEQMGKYDVALETYSRCEQEAQNSEEAHPDLTEVRFRKAVTLMELADNSKNLGDLDEAKKLWKQASTLLASVRQVNGFALRNEATYEHAKLLSQLGDFQNSSRLFAQVADTESDLAVAAAVQGARGMMKLEQFTEAKQLLEKALDGQGTQRDVAAHWMVQVYLKSNQPEQADQFARQWLGKIAKDSPLRPSLLLDLGDAMYAQDKFEASAKQYMDLVNEFPEHPLAPTAIYNAAFSEFKRNSFENAEKLVAAFQTNAPKNHELYPDAMALQADSLSALKKYPQSEQKFRELITTFQNHPDSSNWVLSLALSLYQQEKSKELQDLLKPRLDALAGKQRAEALHWLGLSYFQQEDFQNARTYLTQALETSREYNRVDETLLALSQSQRKLGQADMANSTLDELKNTRGNSRLIAEALYRKGDSAYKAEKFESARNAFEEIIQQHDKSSFAPFAEYKLGWSLVRLGQLNEAQKSFSRFLARHESHDLAKSALLARAMCLREQELFAQAIEDLDLALKLKLTLDEKKDASFEKGLCLIALKKWKDVKQIFSMLIDEYPDTDEVANFYYELAWAQMYLDEKKEAIDNFRILATRFPTHRLAAESNFHVGNAAYEAEDYPTAIKAYEGASASQQAQSQLREKAIHKLGWAHYKSKNFNNAEKVFLQQLKEFDQGILSADAKVMLAESQMQLKKYKEATESYRVAKPAVLEPNMDPNFRWITYLHGAQAANQSKQFDEAIEFANEIIKSDKATRGYKFDAYLELGNAYYGKKNNEKAVEAWQVAEQNEAKTGARARCMIGDVYMGQKKFDDAIAKFKMVVYDFGGLQSSADVKPWQAFASYEIARCYFSQVKNESDASRKSKLMEESVKWFNFLIENYPQDQLRPQAEKQLKVLKRYQSN